MFFRWLISLVFLLTSCHPAVAYTNRIISADKIEGLNSYIKNGLAEKNTLYWSTFADAAATRPADGTGGSPTITWTRTTTTPLSDSGSFLFTHPGTSSYQGEGASYDFTIDKADQAKVLQIRFDYEIASGTYDGGDSSSDSDLIVYLYDVTNAVLIEPSVIKLDGGVSGVQYQYRGEFQTASNSQSYRLILYKATTNTDAFTVKVDNVEVTPTVVSRGAVVTNWQDFTPTGGWTGSVTYTGQWRRIGDSAEVRIKIVVGGAITGTTITLNTPFTIDTTKVLTATTFRNPLGQAFFRDDSAGLTYTGDVLYENSTSVRLTVNYTKTDDTGAASDPGFLGTASNTAPFTFASPDEVYASFRVPIQGWSTSQTLSQDGGTRVVAASLGRSSDLTGVNPNNSAVTLALNSSLKDTHGIVDTANNRIIIPEAGEYLVSFSIHITSTNVLGNRYDGFVLVNGTTDIGVRSTKEAVVSNAFSLEGTKPYSFKAGDYVQLQLFGAGNNSSSTLTVASGQGRTHLSVTKIQGPQQIAATETIAAIYEISGSTANSSFADNVTEIVDYDTRIEDTHGAVTTGAAWRFTAPAPGLYSLSASIQWANATNLDLTVLDVYKNGSAYTRLFTNGSVGVSGAGLVRLNAGDYIDIRALQNDTASGARSINTNANRHQISVHRIGL